MTDKNRKGATYAIILASALLLVSLSVPMFFDDISADTVHIELLDGNDQELDRPIFNTSLYYDTDNTAQGTIFTLSANSPIQTDGTVKLKMVASSGTYGVKVKVYPYTDDPSLASYGSLETLGIRMVFTNENNGSEVFSVDLVHTENPETDFTGEVKDGENMAHFSLTDSYIVTIFTINAYNSSTVPTPAKGLTLDFDPVLGTDTHEVKFYSVNELVKTKVLHNDDPIGEFPPVSNPGYELDGWYDNDNHRVSITTLVKDLSGGYDVTARWYEPEPPDPPGPDPPKPVYPIVTKEFGSYINENGDFVEWVRTTTEYEDGTVNVVEEKITHRDGSSEEMETETTTDPDGKKDERTSLTTVEVHDDGSETWTTIVEETKADGSSGTYESVIDYDKDGEETAYTIDSTDTDSEGNTSKYHSETTITRLDDGTEIWKVDEDTEEKDGSSVISETVTTYYPDGDMESELKDVTYYDPQGDGREYSVIVTNIGDEKDIRYKVEAILPDTTVLDVNKAKEIIDGYTYEIAVVGTSSDTGVLEIPEDSLKLVDEYGYSVSVTDGHETVTLDHDVVSSLAEGDFVLTVERASAEEMTPEQRVTVGNNYSIFVLLKVDDTEVTELHGKADITIEPGYRSVDIYRVEADGTRVLVESEYDSETGIVSFTVDHFSLYMVQGESKVDEFNWLPVIITVAVLAVGALFAIVWWKRRGDDEDSA